MALTDYGSMYGVIEFYQECLKQKIKPLIGFEAYVSEQAYHLVLLAENYEGYKNLMLLSSFGHLRGANNGQPCLDKETLKKHSKNIIALSGCIRGEVPSLLKKGDYEEAKKKALGYQEIFGEDNFYLELQDHPAIEGQMEVNTKIVQLAKETNMPMVVTRDVHYLNQDDFEAQDVLTCIREGWKVGQFNREDFRQVDRSLNSGADILSRFRHVSEAIENTGKIAERIEIKIPLNEWHFAPVDLPAGKTANEVLEENVKASVEKYYQPVTEEVSARLDFELKIIQEKGYAPYFCAWLITCNMPKTMVLWKPPEVRPLALLFPMF